MKRKGYRGKIEDRNGSVSELVDKIAYVGDGEIFARHLYNLSSKDVLEMMLDHGYERCPNCRWFVESYELLTDEDKPKPCDQCFREPENA